MKLLGLLIILNSLVLTGYWIIGEHPHKGWALTIGIVAIIVGIAFTLHERALEITFGSIGTIKAAAQQATIDAKTVSELKNRVEAQSATVDLVAKSAAEAKDKLQELGAITEFSKIVISAQNDDRRAFDKLTSWVEDKSFPMRKEVASAWVQIRTDFGGPLEKGYMNFTWPNNIDPNKLSIANLREAYRSSISIFHAYFVNFVNERKDISKKERMGFLIDVIRDDESLIATSYAGKFFAKEAGIEWKHFVIKPLLDWWEENKNKIE